MQELSQEMLSHDQPHTTEGKEDGNKRVLVLRGQPVGTKQNSETTTPSVTSPSPSTVAPPLFLKLFTRQQ